MNDEAKIIYRLTDKWKESRMLAEEIGCSEKTIRNHLHNLRMELDPACAEIISVRGKGYKLVIHDSAAFRIWKHQKYEQNAKLPDTAADRQRYILRKLLSEKGWIRREDLAGRLLVSEKTISNDLREVDALLGQYDLHREIRPAHGMRLRGSEFSFRQCILNNIVSDYDEKDPLVASLLPSLVETSLRDNGLNVPDYLKKSLTDYLALSIHRIRQGFFIDDEESKTWPRNVGVYFLARYLLDSLVNEGMITAYKDSEAYYASFYLWGNHFVNEISEGMKNYIVPRHTRKMALDLLDMLAKKYGLMVTDDFIYGLIHHTLEVEIRCRYHIRMICPYAKMLERSCPAAWQAGLDAVSFVSEQLERHVSREEPGFYAMLIQPYIPDQYKKVTARMIWNKERAEDHFLYDLLRKRFADCITFTTASDQKTDLTFTTVDSDSNQSMIQADYSLLGGNFGGFENQVHQIVKKILQKRVKDLG